MLIEGELKCNNCGHDFKWYYKVPQKADSRMYDVDGIPDGKVGLYKIIESKEQNGYKIPKKASAYCPKCECLNYIAID